MRIVTKVALLVGLSIAVVMGGFHYVSSDRTEKAMLDEIHHLLVCGLDFAAREVSDRTESVTRTSEIIARDNAISRSLFLQLSLGVNQHLNEMVDIYPFFKYVMVVEPNGDVFAVSTRDNRGHKIAGEELLGLNIRNNPLFSEPSKTGTTVGTPGPDPYLELLGIKGGMNQWFVSPVMKGHTLQGWVVVSYDWETEMSKLLDDITGQLKSVSHPVVETALVDENRKVLVGTVPSDDTFVPGPNTLVNETPLSFGTMNLQLVIANDKAKAMRPITRLQRSLFVARGMATLLLAAILYLVLSRTLLARLALIRTGTQAFRKGDLSYRLPYLGDDELGELGETFNAMGASLQTMMTELKLKKEQLALTFENTPVGLVCSDSSGRFLAANRAFCEMLGYSSDELEGMSIREVTHPDDLAETLAGVKDLLEGNRQTVILEKRYVRKDSSIMFGIVRSGLVRDEKGRPTMLVAAVEDITERKKAQEALSESEKRYRRLFEDAPVMYVITRNEEGVPFIADCNEFFLRSVGRRREEVLGKPLANFYTKESRTALLEGGGYTRALAGEFFIGERQLVAVDGRIIPTLLYTATDEDSSGKVIGTRGMFVDITARKRAELALRQSEQRFKAVFESHHVVMLIIDPETGRIVDASPGACGFYGYSKEELTKKDISEINTLSPEEIFERMQMAAARQRKYFDFRHRLANGELRDVEVCTGPILIGERTFLFSVIHDVTDRKQAELALRESEERLRLIIDSAPVGIRIAQDAKYVYANPAFVKMFGYDSESEIVGLHVDAVVAPESKEYVRKRWADRMAGKTVPAHYEVTCLRKDGSRFDVEGWHTDITYMGKPSWLTFVFDISESKALRSQLVQAQKMEAIGTLAGGVAHDFNNILQVAVGYSELILGDEDLPQHYRDDLQKIHQSARRGAELVQRLLTFSRKTEINPRPLNLNHSIKEMRKMLERTIPKMIEIRLVLADNLNAINADPTQMDQILMNLAVNARDAMPDGGKLAVKTANVVLDEADVASCPDVAPGDYVHLTVSDTGVGMGEEVLEHIFEPFFTTKETGKGSGLGLSIVHGIVHRHGGHIRCSSVPGEGTTFEICLPALTSKEEPQERVAGTMPPGGSETILIVDDDELILDLGSRVLTKAGYTVITASNGREAVDVYQRRGQEISLVILDLIMPEMGGRQCLEGLLKLDPSVKVVVATGFSVDGETKEALASGAKGFVNKPYEVRQILEVVGEALDRKTQ